MKNEQTKLSEAIREGAKLRPQHFGWRFFHEGGSNPLGAAFEANYGTIEYESNKFHSMFNGCYWRSAICPKSDCELMKVSEGNKATQSISTILVHLGIEHKMSREEIADWLEKEGY